PRSPLRPLDRSAPPPPPSAAGAIVRSFSQSQLGDLGEKLVNSQFTQRQESEADDYSYDLLRQRGISPAGLATSFEKLAKLEEGR
ncbi:hypothetical protein NQU37_26440, partial [Escherichia coli]|nr:hypothetical protein [Escherichia coli]